MTPEKPKESTLNTNDNDIKSGRTLLRGLRMHTELLPCRYLMERRGRRLPTWERSWWRSDEVRSRGSLRHGAPRTGTCAGDSCWWWSPGWRRCPSPARSTRTTSAHAESHDATGARLRLRRHGNRGHAPTPLLWHLSLETTTTSTLKRNTLDYTVSECSANYHRKRETNLLIFIECSCVYFLTNFIIFSVQNNKMAMIWNYGDCCACSWLVDNAIGI